MKPVALGALALLIFVGPVLARTHGSRHHSRVHTRTAVRGMPIIAGSDAVRINSVGEVITSPVPITAPNQALFTRDGQGGPPNRPAKP